jgi:muramoyltetrapeptide carboxypeptidase
MLSPLRPGETVAIIAPGGIVLSERLEAGAQLISDAGFVPFIHPQCRAQHGRFAGTDDERLSALHEVFANPDIRAVLCARGGYGCQRFVDRIDFDLLARNPKPFVGYSDITALLNPIAARCGFPAFHGPMVCEKKLEPANYAHLFRVLKGERLQPSDHPAAGQSRVLKEGTAQGKLWGGTLALLAADCGTPSQIRPEILFFEEAGEDLFRFDRMLWQLSRAGVFDQLRGVIVGELLKVENQGEPAFGTDADGILLSHFGARGIPVVAGFPAGHAGANTVLPIGAELELAADKGTVALHHAPLFSA